MEESQIQLLEASWGLVQAASASLAERFYNRLFDIDPALRVLFPQDMEPQRGKLIAAIETVVGSLRQGDAQRPLLFELGARHVKYGVVESDYHAVTNALLGTLEVQLADAFTPEVRAAWCQALRHVVELMQEGARTVADGAGPLGPRQRRMVQGSWALIRPDADRFARVFYGELFARGPGLRTLFAADTSEQRTRFWRSLDRAVQQLGEGPEWGAELRALGRRHVGYGVQPGDYELFGHALLAALAQCLGPVLFTPELRSLWVETYGALTAHMQQLDAAGKAGVSRARDSTAPRPTRERVELANRLEASTAEPSA